MTRYQPNIDPIPIAMGPGGEKGTIQVSILTSQPPPWPATPLRFDAGILLVIQPSRLQMFQNQRF
ncbi:MAG: hypothetical protein BJG00_015975 [Limnothrix sp. CACIAM 69d]|nr:MAG: hypothetical protein BJG00_015975 [Limnothrix sp. CACIAM 69d]